MRIWFWDVFGMFLECFCAASLLSLALMEKHSKMYFLIFAFSDLSLLRLSMGVGGHVQHCICREMYG